MLTGGAKIVGSEEKPLRDGLPVTVFRSVIEVAFFGRKMKTAIWVCFPLSAPGEVGTGLVRLRGPRTDRSFVVMIVPASATRQIGQS